MIKKYEESPYKEVTTDNDRIFLNYEIPKSESSTNYWEIYQHIKKHEETLEDRIREAVEFNGMIDGEYIEQRIHFPMEGEFIELKVYNNETDYLNCLPVFAARGFGNNKRVNAVDLFPRRGTEEERIDILYGDGSFYIEENDKKAKYNSRTGNFYTGGNFEESDLERLQAESKEKFKEADEKYRIIRSKIESR